MAGDVGLHLVLAVDGSASVNYEEFDLMTRGTARALADPEVGAAVSGTPGGVAVAVVQWSSIGVQELALDWVRVTDHGETAALAARVAALPRLVDGGGTMIHAGLDYARALFATAPGRARRRVIDLSGTGRTDDEDALAATRIRLLSRGITINALAVEEDDRSLTDYFRERVAGGPGAFAIRASGWEAFALAMREKLLREIRGPEFA